MEKKIIKNAIVYTMTGSGLGTIENGAVCIEGNKIVAVGTTTEIEQSGFSADLVIDGKGKMAVMPGFIDAHMHSSISLLRGLAQDVPEMEWMHKTIFPFINHIKERQTVAGAKLSVIEGVKYGTTTFIDWGYPIKEAIEQVYMPLGVRVFAAQAINSVDDSTVTSPNVAYPFNEKKGNAQFQENIRLFEEFHGKNDDMVRIMFGPHAVDMLPFDMLKKILDTAKDYGVPIQMHLAQGGREDKQMRLRYGKPAIQLLREEGMFCDKFIAVHCHYASQEELKVMAGEGVRMISCPSSIGIIDGITPPLSEYIEYDGIAGLGSDQACGNNNQSILAELKTTSLLNKSRRKDPTVLPAWKMLRIATIEGAKAIGIDDIVGSIEIGKKADLIIFDLNTPTFTPLLTYPIRNIAHNIVYAARGEEIIYVMINGKIVKEGSKLTFIDEKVALKEVQAAAEELVTIGGELYLKENSTLVKDFNKGLF